jgi:hypothetical protein
MIFLKETAFTHLPILLFPLMLAARLGKIEYVLNALIIGNSTLLKPVSQSLIFAKPTKINSALVASTVMS